jgi:protoporphyrinogen oxidase
MASLKGSAIVVGAGLSGLSAAYKLQDAGFEVTVLERRNRAGGRVKTLRRDGFIIDAGPDAMTTGYVEYLKLAEELGLAQSKVSCSQVIGLIRKGRVIDIDPTRMVAAMFTPALSWAAKLRFAWGLFRVRKMLKGIDGFNLMNAADLDDEQESAAQFSERHFGRETANYLIDPLMRLTAGNGAAQCSRLGVLGALASGSAELVNLPGGLDAMPAALAKELHVVYEADVQSVADAANGGVNLSYKDGAGESHLLHADAAVVATTYDVAERIYPALPAYAGDYSRNLKFVPLISISLAYEATTKSKAYAVLIPTVEQPDILLMFLQQNKSPDRAPAGSSLITLYTDPLAADRLFAQSDDALTAWARREVERFFPELAGHFKFATVSSWPVSGYTAAPGFWRRTRAFRAALPVDTSIRLGGDVFGAGSMESAVAWGVRAAGQVIDHQAAIGNEQKISRSEPV